MKFTGPLLNDRWRLGPRMGSGSQARTFVARDERSRDGRVVVVKQFKLDRSGGSWKSFDLFEREVRVLRTLRHRGIPRYIESFESEPGVSNLVIEKKPGATLRSIARKVRFTDDELRDILARVLEILDYIHRHDPPVIHRDIKPANLLRDADGNVTLVDFGGVRDALRESGGSTVVGTFGYMAPEQLHGQAVPATDLYALGATMVALAGGVEPEDVPRKGLRMDLSRHLRGRDAALIEVLEAMTEPDPEQRPASARAVIALLRKPAERATRTALPGSDAPLTRLSQDDAKRPFDDVGDMLADVPRPIAMVLRVFLLVFAFTGYVSIAALQAVVLPLVFALVGALAGDDARPKITSTRRDVMAALDEGKDSFRSLQKRCLSGPRSRKQLK